MENKIKINRKCNFAVFHLICMSRLINYSGSTAKMIKYRRIRRHFTVVNFNVLTNMSNTFATNVN